MTGNSVYHSSHVAGPLDAPVQWYVKGKIRVKSVSNENNNVCRQRPKMAVNNGMKIPQRTKRRCYQPKLKEITHLHEEITFRSTWSANATDVSDVLL